jgi:nitroreductase
MGLMAHQMGGFDEQKIRQEFSIPDDFQPMSVMAVGYPSADEIQPERKRKPLSDNFFDGSWGKKIQNSDH